MACHRPIGCGRLRSRPVEDVHGARQGFQKQTGVALDGLLRGLMSILFKKDQTVRHIRSNYKAQVLGQTADAKSTLVKWRATGIVEWVTTTDLEAV